MKMFQYISVFAFAILLSTGCKKTLEQNDPQEISDNNAFTTIEHVQYGVNGAYNYYKAVLTDIYKNALVSDEVKVGPGNGGNGLFIFRYQYSSDPLSGVDAWAGYYEFYAMLDQINRVLPYVYTVTGGTQSRKDDLRGQLLALRAIAHFHLLQSFCKRYDPSGLGIAVMTKSDATAKPLRNSMGEVMFQIVSDMNEAKTLLSSGSFTDTVINRVNLAAYQARIALYRGDYDAAINFASEVISTGGVSLSDFNTYINMWKDAAAGEVLFRIRMANSASLGSMFTTQQGQVQWSPSDKLVATYNQFDVRGFTNIGGAPGSFSIKKYEGSNRGNGVLDIKPVRLSEMYLIRAEAWARKSVPNISAGALDLNTVRAARIFGYTPETFLSASELLSAVSIERYKELAFEGFRLYDLKRNNQPVQRAPSDVTSAAWQNLSADDYRFVFPIPQSAIVSNPNTAQNTGY